MPSNKRKSSIVMSAIALLVALAATPALANCYQDAKDLYDSCVDSEFILNGRLIIISEEACAEAAAEIINACLVATGKFDPNYSQCSNRYDFYIPDTSDCPSGWYYTESAFVDLEARHYCGGYQSIRRTITCG